MFAPQQLVLIATERKCPDCGKVKWEWIKSQDELNSGRCSCDSLYNQKPTRGYVLENWIEDGVDLTPYI